MNQRRSVPARAGDGEEAARLLLQALAQYERGDAASANANCARAFALDLEGAEAFLRRALRVPSDDRTASALHMLLAGVNSVRGDLDAALRECNLAVELTPANEDAYLARAAALANLGRQEEATSDLARFEAMGGVIPAKATVAPFVRKYLAAKRGAGTR